MPSNASGPKRGELTMTRMLDAMQQTKALVRWARIPAALHLHPDRWADIQNGLDTSAEAMIATVFGLPVHVHKRKPNDPIEEWDRDVIAIEYRFHDGEGNLCHPAAWYRHLATQLVKLSGGSFTWPSAG